MAELQVDAARGDLAAEYRRRKASDTGARARDIADALGVGEGVLADARRGDGVRRLRGQGIDLMPLLEGLKAAGPMMTLTRNDAVVHETTGVMGEVAHHGHMGQVTGPIDLRLFLRHWHVAYAMSEETRSGLRHSVQVFDAAGTAVIKLYAVGETDQAVWDKAVDERVDDDGAPAQFEAPPPIPADPPDSEIDTAALRDGWQKLEHSHDFFGLLRRIGVGREQALRLAGEDLAFRADNAIVERLLNGAASARVSIMCFVGNRGCMQIFSGPVERIVPMGPWLNVMDPSFNLHLRTDRVASAWVVIKPTQLRGRITSVELFDADRQLICQFFGSRPPGEGEREAWRAVVDQSIGEPA
ncbi:MAG: ChuX/HutX family heme-like substrate-binding protein [Pseudomonadota bacterium]